MVSALLCNDEHRKTRKQCAGWQNLCRFKHSHHLFFAATPTYCHETSSLRFSIHRHVNCAPKGQISSLLVLRETPAAPVSIYREDVLSPISPQPAHNNTENLHSSETKHRDLHC